ncbi:predicted protein [Postia placenta Mad-698-R]|uniref:C2 domain-containing protein n=1 Tax=Postia placenta MAD-698-R-SB12 TaxID=670580 RepID=A0A1X6MP97_9APHY|nr:hypothetical protein POSPLADRAFT_1049473 [Postia placenta MAD-698-R-SB12]EED79792.1 predicted protein [Postia placenta Mad-698-R]OSX58234.1 hypothetical protein POSPLADRAFT_1049473 [Postia placenta MAD-698-R-SB12]
MAHTLGEPYSGKNPVPKIATKLTSLVNPKKATDAKAQQLQSNQQETKQTVRGLAKGHAVHTTDPTTGEELDIRNANTDEDLDLRSKGENVLRHEFPPPDLDKHRETVISTTSVSVLYICGAYMFSFLFAALFSSSARILCFSIVPPSLLAYTLLFRMRNISRSDFEDRAWHAERLRGLGARVDREGDNQIEDGDRPRESVEWLNTVLRGVWPIINTDMFAPMVDIVEDIMQSSAPSFVHSIRISDVGLGSNSARITSIRSLPDADRSGTDSIGESLEVDSQDMSPEDRDALGGDHVNLEVLFAYRGLPSGNAAASKGKNLHVKATLVTLLGMPHITISATPLSENLPNVMNIPFVSGFVSNAINTALAEYVAPKSLTVDLQKLISGDDIKKDTDAIGVLVVHIHRATGLESADTDGKSDPYVTLTFSRLGKPLYSTRIIKGDLNPVFEETAVVMIDVSTVKLRERLSFQLWDSDRVTVDDMLGYHEVGIAGLIRQRGKPIRRISPLSNSDSKHRPGSIEYTVGYYGKIPPNPSLSTDGADPGIPNDLRDKPEFNEARAVALNDVEAAVLTTPPDHAWPSGILSVRVHEIRDLAVRLSGKERKGKDRRVEKGQDEGEETQEEAEGLPSSYCTISLNDELVYETRVKPITSSPMFNAGTERFTRDWRKSHVTVTVKDYRMRENDAVLGVVFMKLSDIFVNASEVTRFYSLEQGVGHGRIRISLLFRPIDAKLSPNLLGFDTGTVEVRDVSVQSKLDLSNCEISMKSTTTPTVEKVSRKIAEKRDDGWTVWVHDDVSALPVRQRYGTALLVSFRDTAGFKSSSCKALGVLWLRDLVDSDEGTVEIALWQAKHGDYSRLKLNYVPPDGNLDYWDTDKGNVERIGSIFLDIMFRPGVSERHKEMLSGAGAKKRAMWDAYDRQKAAGMRDEVGIEDERTSSNAETRRGQDLEVADNTDTGASQQDRTMTDGPLNTTGGDSTSANQENATEGTNTVVSTGDIDDERKDGAGARGIADESHDDADSSDDNKAKGPITKLKDWRQHERELHRDHRGIMQVKPARTAQWMKDNVEEGVHAVKDRFKMHSRQPDVETEV